MGKLIFHFEINKYLKQTNKQNNSNPRPTQPLSLQPIQLDSCVVLHSTSVSASLLSIHAPATLKLQEKLSEKLPCSTTESRFYRRQSTCCQQSFFFVDTTASSVCYLCMEFPMSKSQEMPILILLLSHSKDVNMS